MTLDAFRGLASLVVMVGHLRALFFVPLSGLRAPSMLVKLAYAATSLGHQAVMVFFVLSGYLVGGSVLRAVQARRWSWHDYLSRRAARLYVVLIPALLLTVLWDRLGMRYFGQSGVYGRAPEYAYILPFSIADNQGLTTLVGNGLFVQTIVVPPFGSNSPLWSLANEWWYYLLFPSVVLSLVRTSSPIARGLGAVGAACALWFVGSGIAAYFAVWLLGAALAIVPKRPLIPTRQRLALAFASCVLVVVALRLGGAHPFGRDVAVAVAFVTLLYPVVSGGPARSPTPRAAAFWSDLAGFSYTLYLVHFPLLVFLQAATRRFAGERWQPSVATTALAIAIGLLVVAYAWAVSRVTELQTDRFRMRVVSPLLRTAFAAVGSGVHRGRA